MVALSIYLSLFVWKQHNKLGLGSWNYDVISEIRLLRQSTRIHWRNNLAKFHPYWIGNDAALHFFRRDLYSCRPIVPTGRTSRSSATAERQRISYTRLSQLTHWSCTSLCTASVLQLYNRLAKLVLTLSANKPCDIRTVSWIGHSRSFKVILIGAGRNPEWSVVVMCN